MFYAYCVLATLASTPFFARHVHYGFWPALVVVYFIVLVIGARTVLHLSAIGWGRTLVVPSTLIVLLAIANLYFYPKTANESFPSGGAVAMNLTTAKLMHGSDPYNSLPGEPEALSPGPGWIILNAPLVAMGKVDLVVPFWFALAALGLFRLQPSSATAFTLLTLVQLDFLQMSFVGHDLFAICLSFVFISCMAYLVRDRLNLLIFLAVLAGAAATARAPMIGALLPIIVGLHRSRPRAAVWFGTISLGSAVLINAVFFAWATHDHRFYQPLHLFHRASTGAGPVFAGFGGLLALILLFVMFRRIKPHPRSWLIFNWLIFSAAFVPIGIGELIRVDHFKWAGWEGKNYVSFALASLVAALSLECLRGEEPRSLQPAGRQNELE